MSDQERVDHASKARVTDALKRALEGELVDVAYAPSRISADEHSKTGVNYHSKHGHDHSKATLTPDRERWNPDRDRLNPGKGNQVPSRDAKYLKFAEELVRVKSALDQKT